jgi:23S rRNA (pseudouridine1915-N3)-methyltransferase
VRLYVVVTGKLRTPGLREAADYYLRNVQPWVKVTEVVAAKSMAETLDSLVGPRGAVYALDEKGRSRPTREWAAQVSAWESEGLAEIAICVGGATGLEDAVRARAKGLLGLGPQTLSHELARVVLLEQLYRAWSVTRGHPYHND